MLTDAQKWLVLAGCATTGWLLYLLAPVLTPFMISALLAYLADPIVDRLEAKKLSRTVAVIIVFSVMSLIGVTLLLVLVPILERQTVALIGNIPQALTWLQEVTRAHLSGITGMGGLGAEGASLDVEAVRTAITDRWREFGGALTRVFSTVFQSGQVVLAWLAYLLLIPVVTFYLLRDWDLLVASVHDLIPRAYEATVSTLSRECDEVLAQFMRGQLLVMAALGLIYTVGLWAIGLELAFLIGLVSGLVSFVPYLGFFVGILLAGFASVMQFQDVLHPIYVVIVFAVGQAIEGMLLSPILVGDRIGLHPVAVIFAVLAGGQLFGFFGILLALPVAAVIVVLLRHFRSRYLDSALYTPAP
jgi:predicted PurR-regulated permease PerM